MDRRKMDLPDCRQAGQRAPYGRQWEEGKEATDGVSYPLALGVCRELCRLAAGCCRRGREDLLDCDGHDCYARGPRAGEYLTIGDEAGTWAAERAVG